MPSSLTPGNIFAPPALAVTDARSKHSDMNNGDGAVYLKP
jgi:hypothetical protein